MLLIRIRGRVGESFRGWVSRLAHENGYRNGDWMCRHLLVRRLDGLTLLHAQALIGGSIDDVRMFEGVVPEMSSARHRLVVNGERLPLSLMRMSLRRVCPACLDEAGMARGIWESFSVSLCRQHDAQLVGVCPKCQRPLSWTTMGLFKCSCSADLREIPTTSPTSALREVDSLLAGKIAQLSGIYSKTWASLPIGERLELIWTLGMIASAQTGSRKRAMSHELALRLMEAAGEALLDWPNRLFVGLSALDKEDASLRTSLGPSYNWLQAEERPRELEPLRLALIEYAREHRAAPLHHKARSTLGLTTSTEGCLTATGAARRLGIARSAVSGLVESGRLAGASANAGRRRLFKIEASEVERYRTRRESGYRREEVRKLFGITKRRFNELCDSGLLPVLEGGSATAQAIWRLDREGVDTLLKVLGEDPTKLSELPSGGIAVGTAMRAQLGLGELAATLAAVCRKELAVLGRLESGGVIAGLVIEAAELREFLEHHRHAKSETISIVETASRLSIKQQVAYHLVTSKLLSAELCNTARRSRRRISVAAVSAFRNRYIWMRDIANVAGTSPKTVRRWLDESGIKPVAAPDVDGCRQTLYERNCVAPWLAKHQELAQCEQHESPRVTRWEKLSYPKKVGSP